MGGLNGMGIRGGRTHYIEMRGIFFEEDDCSSLCQFAKLFCLTRFSQQMRAGSRRSPLKNITNSQRQSTPGSLPSKEEARRQLPEVQMDSWQWAPG